MRLAKERERELQRLEHERRRHLERVMKEQVRGLLAAYPVRCPHRRPAMVLQKKEEERRIKEAAKLQALQVLAGWQGGEAAGAVGLRGGATHAGCTCAPAPRKRSTASCLPFKRRSGKRRTSCVPRRSAGGARLLVGPCTLGWTAHLCTVLPGAGRRSCSARCSSRRRRTCACDSARLRLQGRATTWTWSGTRSWWRGAAALGPRAAPAPLTPCRCVPHLPCLLTAQVAS